MRIATAIACGLLPLGCHQGLAPVNSGRESVSQCVSERFGTTVGCAPGPSELIVPPGLSLGQALSEDHAVMLALWNNPAFQELLVELQLTRATLLE